MEPKTAKEAKDMYFALPERLRDRFDAQAKINTAEPDVGEMLVTTSETDAEGFDWGESEGRQAGQHWAGVIMSLIHTAELSKANPFDYLVALQRHHDDVANNPGAWMPWNFRESLERLTSAPAPTPD